MNSNLKRFTAQINQVVQIISTYNGQQPFHLHLTQFFKKNKQFGSKDRKFYRQISYAYWRLGIISENAELLESILIACSRDAEFGPMAIEYFQFLYPNRSIPVVPNSDTIGQTVSELLDKEIQLADYANWFVEAAPVYIVAEPSNNAQITTFLQENSIADFDLAFPIKIPAGTNCAAVVDAGYARVMDYGSWLCTQNLPIQKNHSIWDCCCGSGGKALQISSSYKPHALYCSDNRPAIVENAKKRFAVSPYAQPHFTTLDLYANHELESNIEWPAQMDIVFADVPCTGSGTWRRNPENLHFFNADKLHSLNNVQLKIATHAVAKVKSGGYFVYVTCSVFEQENAAVVKEIMATTDIQLLEMQYLGGPEKDADYFFRAIFKKP